MVPPKFELFDIQNGPSINTILAVQVSYTNIHLFPKYLKGVFCDDCILVDGDELRIINNDETILVHPMEYIVIDRQRKIFTMNERTFRYIFNKRGM